MVINKKHNLLLGVALLLLLVLLAACKAEPSYSPSPPLDSPPDYLDEIWPLPDSEIPYDQYADALASDYPVSGETGIGVKLSASEVAEPGDFDVDWPSRCSLFVDGVLVPDRDLVIMDGLVQFEGVDMEDEVLYSVGGPYYLIWSVSLESGVYQVDVQVRQTSGAILGYAWQFTILP